MPGILTLSTLSDGTNSTSATNAIQGSAKAWVNFNGTGTVAIRSAFNVSSITDNGTGLYTVNFTTAMPDTNYCGLASNIGDNISADGVLIGGTAGGAAKTTSSIQVRTAYCVNNTSPDQAVINVAIFR